MTDGAAGRATGADADFDRDSAPFLLAFALPAASAVSASRASRASAARISRRVVSIVFVVDWRFRTSRGAVLWLKKKT